MSPRYRSPLSKISDKYRSVRSAGNFGQSPRVKIGAAAAAALAAAGVATAVATSATPTASAAGNLSAASHAALHSPAGHQAGHGHGPAAGAHAAPSASHSAAAAHGTATHTGHAQPATHNPATHSQGAHNPATHSPAPAKTASAPAKRAPAKAAAAVHTSGKAAPKHSAAPAKPASHKAKPAAHQAVRAHKAPARHDYLIYDSVTPSALPSHHEVAIYANGGYAAPRSAAAGLPMLYIDTNGSNPNASVLDVEPGDASPAGAAAWAMARLRANPHALARIYTMRSEWAATKAAVDTLPASMRSRVRWWIADPTGVPHIVPGSDATQWYWGSGYDISTATPKFG